MSALASIFLTRHRELRVVWRLALFVVGASAATAALVAPAVLLKPPQVVMLALVVAAVLLATWAVTRFVNRKPFGAVGLAVDRRAARQFGLGVLLGFLMMTGIFLVQLATGWVTVGWGAPPEPALALGLALLLLNFSLAGFLEELVFRGYLFQTLIQGVTFLPALLLMSVVFALAHGRNPGVGALALVNIGLAGVWLSFAYFRTRSLWLPTGLHLSWNFTQTGIYGFPTSGIAPRNPTLLAPTQWGPEWVTGGSFGPEAGLLATVALIACTWYILKSSLTAAPAGIVTLDSVEDLLPGGDGTPRAGA